MKIIVFSDSHGDSADMLTAIDQEHPNVLFHLGDCWRDVDDVRFACSQIPLYQVPGNCDWMEYVSYTQKLVSLDGVRFLLCHGHTYGVKSGYSAAVRSARDERVDVLLCGHTHVPYYQDFGGLQLMNPGSLRYTHTYGIITAQKGLALCSVKTLEEG